MTKFGAIPTEVDGIRFASRAEARHYGVLRLLERAGEIADLVLQPAYPLIVNGHKVATYIADFRYRDVATGEIVVVDVKGGRATVTPVYRLKRRLMLALYGIEIKEVQA